MEQHVERKKWLESLSTKELRGRLENAKANIEVLMQDEGPVTNRNTEQYTSSNAERFEIQRILKKRKKKNN